MFGKEKRLFLACLREISSVFGRAHPWNVWGPNLGRFWPNATGGRVLAKIDPRQGGTTRFCEISFALALCGLTVSVLYADPPCYARRGAWATP